MVQPATAETGALSAPPRFHVRCAPCVATDSSRAPRRLNTAVRALRQVFQGCQSSVAKECQLGTSVMTDTITQRGSMIGIAMSLTAVASMIRVFGSERVVYWREAQTLPQPRHTIAYFLGKDISMIPSVRVLLVLACGCG